MKFLIPVDGSVLSLEAVRHVLKLAHAGLQTELLLAAYRRPSRSDIAPSFLR